MRFESNGMGLWYGTPDAPTTDEVVQAGSEASITVGVRPVHASNSVDVLYRISQGPAGSTEWQRVPAKWWQNDFSANAQYFTARLPTFPAGSTVEYSAICRGAGLQVPSTEEATRSPSSFRVDAEANPSPDTPGLAESATTAEIVSRAEAPSVEPARAPATEDLLFPHASEVSRLEVFGRLFHEKTGSPLVAFAVRAVDLDAANEPQHIGSYRTDEEGRFALVFTSLTGREVLGAGRRLALHILNPEGNEVHRTEILVTPGQEQLLDLRVPFQETPESPSPTLTELSSSLSLNLSPALLSSLADKGIHTLADIRNAGGIRLEAVPNAHLQTVKALEAHAHLSVLPTSPALNASLINAGYTSLAGIARTPIHTFAASIWQQVGGEGRAVAVHAAASAQMHLLGNLLTDLRVNGDSGSLGAIQPLSELLVQSCSCEECQNATSQLAYLADLLDYALRHLTQNGNPVTLTFLEDRFRQPFRGLPANCAASEQRLRQVRICIEVLRRYLPVQYRNYAPPWYLEAAYLKLLEENGTSFEEVRRARGLREDERMAIGRRLMVGVDPQPGHHDQLDELFHDPVQVTEGLLHQLFGLRDTTLDPLQPDPKPGLLIFRQEFLRRQWKEEDWPQNAAPGARPLIDPDVISLADIRDTTSTNPVFRLWDDRRAWVERVMAEMDDYSNDPAIGLDRLLQNGQYGLGSNRVANDGPGVNGVIGLRRRLLAGDDISTHLSALRLSREAFDYLSSVIELDASGTTVLHSEWEGVYAILMQRVKVRDMFPTWRQQEQNAQVIVLGVNWTGIELSPDHFQLRPPPHQGVPAWSPKQWRSTGEVRSQWIDTLKVRLQQDQAVIGGIQAAVNSTEEYLLGELRNEMLRTAALPGLLTPEKLKLYTDHLQIDVEADVCQMTTRVAQAIQTIQGVLFGARYGLLEDASITLDVVEFDEEWKWMGSCEAWRSAILIFLYPEDALRPTLRQPKSPAFEALIKQLRSAGHVDPVKARELATDYADYFADVTSLGEFGFYASARPFGGDHKSGQAGAEQTRYVLAVARALGNGKHYFSTFKQRLVPSQYAGLPPVVAGSQVENLWTKVPSIPENSEVVGLLPYEHTLGKLHIGLYARVQVDGTERLSFTSYDGTDWGTKANISDFPSLVRSAQADATKVAPDPAAAAGGVAAATLQGDERLVAADFDGDGRKEVLAVAAAPDAGGRRPVSMLREWTGGLATAWTGALPAGWRLSDESRPVVLRVSLNVYPWQADRVLVVNDIGPEIGILGWQPGAGLVVLWSSSDAGGWPVALSNNIDGAPHPTRFVAANVDGFGVKVLAFEHRASGHVFSPVKTTVTVLDWVNGHLVFQSSRDLDFHVDADQSTATRSEDYDIQWERFVPVGSGFGPREDILVLSARTERTRAYVGDVRYKTSIYLQTLLWDRTLNRFRTALTGIPPGTINVNTVPGAAGQSDWTLSADDEVLAITPGASVAWQHVLVRSPSRRAVGVLRYRPNGTLETVWQTSDKIPGRGNLALGWQLQPGDRQFVADTDGDGAQEIVTASQDGRRLGLVDQNADGSLVTRWIAWHHVFSPNPADAQRWQLTPVADTHAVAADLDGDGLAELVLLTKDRRLGVLRGVPRPKTSVPGLPSPLRPIGVTALTIGEKLTPQELATRRAQVQATYAANAANPPSPNQVYLDEAYFLVPMELGLRLRAGGHYAEALDWFRTVYDYGKPVSQRKVPTLLIWEETLPDQFERSASWLADTLNPHSIAATRRNSYTKFTLLAIIQCLLEFADAEFSLNAPESLPRARELYLSALDLIDSAELGHPAQICNALINSLTIQVGEDEERWVWHEIRKELSLINDPAALVATVDQVRAILNSSEPRVERYQTARKAITTARQNSEVEPTTFEGVLAESNARLGRAATALLADPQIARQAKRLGMAVAGRDLSNGKSTPDLMPRRLIPVEPVHRLDGEHSPRGYFAYEYVTAPSLFFCVPPNPAIQIARRWAEANLFKIRTCRDITGMQQAGERRPAQYRFAVLIERSKELVRLAGQVEAALLTALERRDQEYFNLLRAHQDLQVTRATVQLQALRVRSALNRITLAGLQEERAQVQAGTYAEWINAGLNEWERAVIYNYNRAAAHQSTATVLSAWGSVIANFGPNVADYIGSMVQFFAAGFGAQAEWERARAQVSAVHASHERKKDEWELAQKLAEQDTVIAGVQVLAAEDEVRIEEQEQTIAGMRAEHAEVIVDFLSRKFTSFDLYDWMSDILERVYRFFLQQATATAQAASQQLAFERQESLTRFIKPDYWLPPSAEGEEEAEGRRGLTGSARLSQDIYQLDQYAFQTNRQKQQLVKVISLSQFDPYAFEQFRQTGVMRFATPMELFDRDFPGHYLRLIRRVRTSVIALIPPTQGVRAVLASSGISRVVVADGQDFQTVVVRREPESVALSSPVNATGLFELEAQPEVPFSFEWTGVDSAWELRMPKASNPFDYNTLADVLLTIEYTALDSLAYRRGVLKQFASRIVIADRPFSFRHEFADAWYDLNNSDPTASAIGVTFDTRIEDFPPNLEELNIERILLNFIYAKGRAFTMEVNELYFTPEGRVSIAGGPGTSDQQGLISSRNGGGAARWSQFKTQANTVAGRWELHLPNREDVRNRFKNEDIENILFVITYSGRTADWPA